MKPRYEIYEEAQGNGRVSLRWDCSNGGREMFRAVDFCGMTWRPDNCPKRESIMSRFGEEIKGEVRKIRTLSANKHNLY